MNPRFPVYIVSKGRHDTRLTSRTLEKMGVPYRIVVEEQERAAYAAVIDPAKVLVLDPEFQRKYDTYDDLGDSKGKGPGPARNFVWEHSISEGHAWHWVCDDNIDDFYRLNRNSKIRMQDGTGFACMEDFVERYTNIAMAGPAYEMFAPRKYKLNALVLNTRIYSCNLIRNDLQMRWRGRYNEDTDLSLRMLKAGWCTVQFFAFLQKKIATQKMKGGNTAEFYEREGTLPKSRMLCAMHPDVARLKWRFGRWHHLVDYSVFRDNHLRRRPGYTPRSGFDDYGLKLVDASAAPRALSAA